MGALLVPRIVVAGTSSGVGKTTTVVGLIAALRARGLRVAAFKCGPDYLDPTYHARAAGASSHNLDGWMMGRSAVLSTFARASAGADVALIEGVMGLYDGASPSGEEGSTAEIAKWLGAPVLLVVDASGMARSIAALAQGFAAFDPEVSLAGVLANRVGSRGHVEILRKALHVPPILGALPKAPELAFPERHLGLRTANEEAVPQSTLEGWGGKVEEWFALDAILEVARAARPIEMEVNVVPVATPRCRIGLAFDEAFHFYYDDNLARLVALGAELVRFSPLHDAHLPCVDGLYLGGGYPEVHAAALAENVTLRQEVAAFAALGLPIYAECGGLMYLCEGIETLDKKLHPMVGCFPAHAVMHDRLQALGYVEVETQERSLLGAAGIRFRGHQFRYSELRFRESDMELVYTVRRRRGGDVQREGFRLDNVLASYVHAHWASNPLCAEGLVGACCAYARRRGA